MGKQLGVIRELRGKWSEGMEQNKCKQEGRSAYEGEGLLRKWGIESSEFITVSRAHFLILIHIKMLSVASMNLSSNNTEKYHS